jgi:hypothetical protein
MTNKSLTLVSVSLLLSALLLAGCGGGRGVYNGVMPISAGTSNVTVTMTDTPPPGVTILSFEINVTAATLNPGNVQLVTAPHKIEVKRLETESAFLAAINVPAGTYQSITVMLANPELTFLNQSNAAIGSCQVNTVCEVESNATGSITFSGSPFPVMLSANVSTGFLVDLNLSNIITSTLGVDFGAANALTVTQLAKKPAGDLDDLDDLKGVVQNLDATNKTFTIHTFQGDFQITTDDKTKFESEVCGASNFSCLQNGQVVGVDAMIMSGGVFLAKKVEFEDDAADDELEGVVSKIDDSTHFEMVVLDELRAVNSVNVGNPIVLTLNSGASFKVKADGLSVPSALQAGFEGATDTSQLIQGQVVQVHVVGSVNAGPPIAVSTNRVRLRFSQFTASVSGAPAPPNFTVGSLPPLFTNAGITSVHVQTSNKTDFEGVSDVSGLADGNTVSLRGLLFKNGANPPELIAKKVRKR